MMVLTLLKCIYINKKHQFRYFEDFKCFNENVMQYKSSISITLQRYANKFNLECHIFEVSFLISFWLNITLIVFFFKSSYLNTLAINYEFQILFFLLLKLRLTKY